MTDSDLPRERADPETPAQWAQVRALVENAVMLPRESRGTFLDASCGGDRALRDRVERLADACDRADGNWGFLAQPAGELAAPLVAGGGGLPEGDYAVDAALPLRPSAAASADMLARLNSALGGRYRAERELASGGMATVYVAHDLRHQRRVAIKVLHSELSAMLGAERFLSEIRTTAALQHPHILPLFDSGDANGLLFYVMPLVEGETLRARLLREKQLAITDALRITRDVADALDYAHRHGIVHRDIKPENILLHDGRPLVADFGIALAVQSIDGGRMTRPGLSLGTPPYMSPEQAAGNATLDGRSDIYSLACVLYELLVGDPPFTGRTAQAVIAKVLSDAPSSARTVRPSIPPHVDAALLRALAKLPADRHTTARDFAEALGDTSINAAVGAYADAHAGAHAVTPAVVRGGGSRWAVQGRLMLGGALVLAGAGTAWMATRLPAGPAEITVFPYPNLIDATQFGAVTITPDGRALVYTGSAEAGRPFMLWPLGEREPRIVPGTEGGMEPAVSPDGRRLLFRRSGAVSVVTLEGLAGTRARGAWKYGNGGWVDDRIAITEGGPVRGLYRHVVGEGAGRLITRPDSTKSEFRHLTPLILPRGNAVVFTVTSRPGPGLHTGPLAIAALESAPLSVAAHTHLAVTGRRAIAFVDGWLLYTAADGKAIMAVRLDVERARIVGTPVPVLRDAAANIETAALADDGTLLYLQRPRVNSVLFVDDSGAVRPGFASPQGSFMNPRLSPDGKRFVVQVDGATGKDVWLYDIASRAPTQLTTSGRAVQPTWTPDGRRIVYMGAGSNVLISQPVDGGAADTIPGTENAFAPTVSPDGRSVLFYRRVGKRGTIWSAPLDASGPPKPVMEDRSPSNMPAVSPDGRWIAYTSRSAGGSEIFVRPFPGPGPAVQVSDSGGTEPAWSPDGRRLYYRANGAFMMATVTTPTFAVTSRRRLFRDASDNTMPHRDYDVSPDGRGFLMIAPATAGTPEAVRVLNWLAQLREQLAREP